MPDLTPVRMQVRKAAFPELRNAFLRFGGPLTAKFIDLGREIDDYAFSIVGVLSADLFQGLYDALDRIELKARDLRDEASEGMKKDNACLAETQDE